MTEISISSKLFAVTTNHDQGWVYFAERSQLGVMGGIIPPFIRVLGNGSSRMFGPAVAVTMGGQLVAYRYHQAQEQSPSCEVMVLNV